MFTPVGRAGSAFLRLFGQQGGEYKSAYNAKGNADPRLNDADNRLQQIEQIIDGRIALAASH